MKSPGNTEKRKAADIKERLERLEKQPLPQYKTDMALRNMDSALKVIKEFKEQHQNKNGH